jgi:ribosomal protein S12 methylthiotransferase
VSDSAPRVGFVSLGCPKALVDSERILTRLRSEGYDVVGTYESADLVVVNTCGFIDDAVHESLDAIGEALARNGRVIVTGCLGARPEKITERHPSVLKVTGPHAYEEVVSAVHEHLPPQHDPFVDLVPPQGIRLTPRHYAYLKISEGCNHRCSFCIIPSMRGDLASCPIGDVMVAAERLVKAGVKELLVISQDTSAYGADLRYATSFWGGRPLKTRFVDLARALGTLGVWVRLHYVYPYPHVDDVIPLMAEGKVLPYLDVPFQHGSRGSSSSCAVLRMPRILWSACAAGARSARTSRCAARSSSVSRARRRGLRGAARLAAGRTARSCRLLQVFAGRGRRGERVARPGARRSQPERWNRFMQLATQLSREKLTRKVGQRMRVLVDSIEKRVAVALVGRCTRDRRRRAHHEAWSAQGGRLGPGRDYVGRRLRSRSEDRTMRIRIVHSVLAAARCCRPRWLSAGATASRPRVRGDSREGRRAAYADERAIQGARVAARARRARLRRGSSAAPGPTRSGSTS